MFDFSKITAILHRRGKIVGFPFYDSIELNKYWKIFVFLCNLNLGIAIAELVGFCYVVRNDLMKLMIQSK